MRHGLIMIGIVLVVAWIVWFLHWNNKSIVTTYYTYESEKLPKAFDGYRVTQVSDLQSEYFGKEQRNLIKKVKKSKPDMIVFTGDLLDRNHTNFDAARICMKGLLEIAPVYYVNGNHEMALDQEVMDDFYEELRDMGVNVLFDQKAVIEKKGEQISILGLSEHVIFACKDYIRDNGAPLDKAILNKSLAWLRQRAGEDDFTILLTHEPQLFADYAAHDFDLIFAGHAHGGQIRLPFTDGLYSPGQGLLPNITSGIRKDGASTIVISRGLGNSTFPFRVFNRPEIVVVDFKTGNN